MRAWIYLRRTHQVLHLGCLLTGHRWGWPEEIRIAGRWRGVRKCRRCPAVKWL